MHYDFSPGGKSWPCRNLTSMATAPLLISSNTDTPAWSPDDPSSAPPDSSTSTSPSAAGSLFSRVHAARNAAMPSVSSTLSPPGPFPVPAKCAARNAVARATSLPRSAAAALTTGGAGTGAARAAISAACAVERAAEGAGGAVLAKGGPELGPEPESGAKGAPSGPAERSLEWSRVLARVTAGTQRVKGNQTFVQMHESKPLGKLESNEAVPRIGTKVSWLVSGACWWFSWQMWQWQLRQRQRQRSMSKRLDTHFAWSLPLLPPHH